MDIISKKGHRVNLPGQPDNSLQKIDKPSTIAVLPVQIPFIKPRLSVKTGDHVNIGSTLYVDKRNPSIRFLSPGSGYIETINYGPRRVIEEIVITLDDTETEESFSAVTRQALHDISREDLTELMIQGGVWPFIRELPFRDIADYTKTPPSIIVTLDSSDYFMPSSEVYLQDNESLFLFGLDVLKKLSDTVYVSTLDGKKPPEQIQKQITHTISGRYPAGDPGVLLYNIKKTAEENNAWYLFGQDLLHIASLVQTGKYPVEKIITIAGNGAPRRQHVKTRAGSPVRMLSGIQSKKESDSLRFISGGIFRGYSVPWTSFMGFYESALTILPEGNEEEFFGFLRAGYQRQSFSRTFLSVFNKNTLPVDCKMHGENRACINCGYCPKVCPVDIFPQFTMKSIIVGEVEEALAHGVLDCVDCGLCTYVCPSKIDIAGTLRSARADYYKERV